jgi:hypothetical protein
MSNELRQEAALLRDLQYHLHAEINDPGTSPKAKARAKAHMGWVEFKLRELAKAGA